MDRPIAVVGGGPVGTALACALVRHDPVVLASARAPQAEGGPRAYAISPANAAFLARIGAWPARATAVHAMRIEGDAGGVLEFDALEAGVAELAWIVEEASLAEALAGALARSGAALRAPVGLRRLSVEGRAARLEFDDGEAIDAALVVGADGADSAVREASGIGCRAGGYGQAALVLTLGCARAHGAVARQWFRGGEVIALLPLGDDRVSLVWSLATERAQKLHAAGPAHVARELESAIGGALGALEAVSAAALFPLRRLVAHAMAAPRIALAGDSAHVIHPLAGQGVNLGLGDAECLARVLAAREPGRDAGDYRLLRRYERARAGDILAMRMTVDALHALFAAPEAFWRVLRNLGLGLVDRLAPVKDFLVRRARGSPSCENC